MANRTRLLVVDDALDTLDILEQNLVSRGFEVVTATGARSAMEILEKGRFDLVLTDLRMPEVDGMELVRFVRSRFPDTEVMMITGFATIESAVEAVKLGAEEYLPKPFTAEELFAAVDRVLAKLEGERERRRALRGKFGLVGESLGMRKAFAAIRRAVGDDGPVSILGEFGTGRRAVARVVASERGVEASRIVECGAADLRKGSAKEWRKLVEAPGAFLLVSGLEEADDESQGALVDLLGRTTGKAGRVAFASIPLLPLLGERELLRRELFEALAPHTILLPAVREREGDIPLLAQHFLGLLAPRLGAGGARFSGRCLSALTDYDWPGNVGELRAAVFDAALRTAGRSVVDLEDLPVRIRERGGSGDGRSLVEAERDHVRKVLARTGGNKRKAAEILGIDRKTLREKLKGDSDDSSGDEEP